MRTAFGASMAVTLRRHEQGGQYHDQHDNLVRNGCPSRRRYVTARFLCAPPAKCRPDTSGRDTSHATFARPSRLWCQTLASLAVHRSPPPCGLHTGVRWCRGSLKSIGFSMSRVAVALLAFTLLSPVRFQPQIADLRPHGSQRSRDHSAVVL